MAKSIEDPYRELATSILLQTISDGHDQDMLPEIRLFFSTQWFETVCHCAKIDPVYFLRIFDISLSWPEIRLRALNRAHVKCEVCKSEDKKGNRLCVYHLNGYRMNCEIENLIVLCPKCVRKKHMPTAADTISFL